MNKLRERKAKLLKDKKQEERKNPRNPGLNEDEAQSPQRERIVKELSDVERDIEDMQELEKKHKELVKDQSSIYRGLQDIWRRQLLNRSTFNEEEQNVGKKEEAKQEENPNKNQKPGEKKEDKKDAKWKCWDFGHLTILIYIIDI